MNDEKNEIIFCVEKDKWIMKINHLGRILFNREDYPNSTPDDFSRAVVEILEKEIVVKGKEITKMPFARKI